MPLCVKGFDACFRNEERAAAILGDPETHKLSLPHSPLHRGTPARFAPENTIGSCVASMRWQFPEAHPSDQLGCDSLCIHHGFVCRHIEMQVSLVNTPKHTQVGPERRTGSFAGIGVHLTPAIPILIPGPFVDAVAHGGVGRMAATIALPFIRIQDRALLGLYARTAVAPSGDSSGSRAPSRPTVAARVTATIHS
jgi:hypothetical protein